MKTFFSEKPKTEMKGGHLGDWNLLRSVLGKNPTFWYYKILQESVELGSVFRVNGCVSGIVRGQIADV